MTLQELIDAVMLKATGKATILASNNAKWEKIRGIANQYQKIWANEPNANWNSLYERARTIGTIGTKDSFPLDDEVAYLSTARGDSVFISHLDGHRTRFSLVEYNDLQNHSNGFYVAVVGRELVLNKAFKPGDPQYGRKLYAPVYLNIEELESGDDDIIVDDPMWLVLMCAAEYIRNDIVKQNQYGNLIAEANNLMRNMLNRNRGSEVRKVRGNFRNAGGFDL